MKPVLFHVNLQPNIKLSQLIFGILVSHTFPQMNRPSVMLRNVEPVWSNYEVCRQINEV